MNMDELEQRLQKQPLRQVPGEWREEILAAARQASRVERTQAKGHRHCPSPLSTLYHQLSTFLWPHPAAWAGLAAVWLVILGLDLATHDTAQGVASRGARPSPQVFMAFQEQQRLLTELIGPREAPVAEPPKQAPLRPRSERQREIQMA